MAGDSLSQPDAKTAVKRLLIGSIKPLFFVLLGLAVFWFLSSQIGNGSSILTRLNEAETARGLITFVVATSTVAAAIILLLAAIISDGTESDIKMRLSEGRQVLAPFIGILGTIVGFYFAQPSVGPNQPAALRVGAVTLSAERVAVGGVVTVTSTVSGGRAPYEYTITLPGVGQPLTGKLPSAGDVKQDVTIPMDAKSQTVTIQLQVKDSAGASVESKSERPLAITGS